MDFPASLSSLAPLAFHSWPGRLLPLFVSCFCRFNDVCARWTSSRAVRISRSVSLSVSTCLLGPFKLIESSFRTFWCLVQSFVWYIVYPHLILLHLKLRNKDDRIYIFPPFGTNDSRNFPKWLMNSLILNSIGLTERSVLLITYPICVILLVNSISVVIHIFFCQFFYFVCFSRLSCIYCCIIFL